MCGVLCLFQIIMTLYKSVLMTIECVQAECADSIFCDMLENIQSQDELPTPTFSACS